MKHSKAIKRTLFSVVLAATCAIGLTSCAACDSAFKSWDIDMDYCDRHITAYHPYTGKVVYEYDGKCYVVKDDYSISITTEDGKQRINLVNVTAVVEGRA